MESALTNKTIYTIRTRILLGALIERKMHKREIAFKRNANECCVHFLNQHASTIAWILLVEICCSARTNIGYRRFYLCDYFIGYSVLHVVVNNLNIGIFGWAHDLTITVNSHYSIQVDSIRNSQIFSNWS